MVNGIWVLVILAAAILTLGFLVKARHRHRLVYWVGMPLTVLFITIVGGQLALLHAYFWFEYSVGENGAMIVVQHGRDFGGPFMVDTPPYFYAGHVWSFWLTALDDKGIGDPCGCPEGQPRRWVWEGPERCWVERYPSGEGTVIERDQTGEWTLRQVSRRTSQRCGILGTSQPREP